MAVHEDNEPAKLGLFSSDRRRVGDDLIDLLKLLR